MGFSEKSINWYIDSCKNLLKGLVALDVMGPSLWLTEISFTKASEIMRVICALQYPLPALFTNNYHIMVMTMQRR